jgi:hypothetical protein
MLKCSASSDIVTIPNKLGETHVKQHQFLLSITKEGMEQVNCNPLPYFKCNGSATVTNYWYFI